jgi:adenosylhomocysteine nucleosidase
MAHVGLVAVRREILPLLEACRAAECARQGDAILYEGQIAGCVVALVEVLPGPVNAALGAQALILHQKVSGLISAGSAGALEPGLLPGDLILGERTVVHDSGVFFGSRFEPAGVMGRDETGRAGYRRAFDAAGSLVALGLEAAGSLGEKVRVGTVATGNQLILSTARKRWLHQTFGALAVEMESAAVAQVAVAHSLPWLAVRAISDTADDAVTGLRPSKSSLALELDRLRTYLDDGRPAWQLRASRYLYLLAHPAIWRRLRHLHKGLALASGRAARLVVAMLQA